jgi:hypothetical protein
MAQRVTSGAGASPYPGDPGGRELPGVLRDVLYLDIRRSGAQDTAMRITAAVRGRSVDDMRKKLP